VKVLYDAPGRSRSSRRRFERELELVSSLRDPRVVQVFDGGALADGRSFVVMELVEGAPLDAAPAVAAARAEGFARPAADAAIALFAEVCEAVDHAHRRGVIHRDLKPSNILVDAAGRPRVLDFGLAKVQGGSGEGYVTTAGARFVGSLPWTSPEQAQGLDDAVDVRSDVYALGAILYQLVTSAPPYDASGDLRRALDSVVNAAPAPPGRAVPTCDPDVEAVTLRALEKDPARRYATAGELARDLRRLLAGEPIEARRETAWRALTKAARRRKRAAVLSAVAGTVLAALLIMTATSWRRSETSLTTARSSLAFVLDAMGSVDPARDGVDAKLVDALDHMSADLDRRFSDDAVRLEFRTKLRDVYVRIGRYDRALAEAEEVARLADRILRPDDRSRLNGETIRALALHRLRRDVESEAVYRETGARLEAAFGPADADALGAAVGRGVALRTLGKLDDAEAIASRVVEATASARTGAVGKVGAEARELAAQLAKDRGRPADALALQREATARFTEALGEDSPESLGATSSLAASLLELGMNAEAAQRLERALPRLEGKSGPTHPSTLAARHNYGVALYRSDKTAEGEDVLRKTHRARVETLGPEAQDTLLTLNEVIVAMMGRGDAAGAEPLMRMLVEARRRRAATQPRDYWISLNNLAGLIRDRGAPAEAEPLYEEAVDAADAALGSGHWMAAVFRGNYGRCLTDLERFDEAEDLLADALVAVEKTFPSNHSHVAAIRTNIDRNKRRRGEAESRAASRPS
jgi:eukaryotic-like serine/threonine-protein kinase